MSKHTNTETFRRLAVGHQHRPRFVDEDVAGEVVGGEEPGTFQVRTPAVRFLSVDPFDLDAPAARILGFRVEHRRMLWRSRDEQAAGADVRHRDSALALE
jgi:hypothetical protein